MVQRGTVYLVATIVSVACCASAESDLDEYVASIKRSGMSERAAGDLRMVVGILSGGTTFKATKSPDGTVGRSYGSPTEHRTWKERSTLLTARSAAQEAWAEFLKGQADTDGSGFVSTKEGEALRRRVETGIVAAQLRPANVEELYDAGPAASQVEADLSAYTAMRAEAVRQGLEGMPALPAGLDTTPR